MPIIDPLFLEARAVSLNSTSKAKREMAAPIPDCFISFFEEGAFQKGDPGTKATALSGLGFPYVGVRYPPQARENWVQGTVVIMVVNALGQLESAEIKQSIGYGCAEEALNALKNGAKAGLEPVEFIVR